MDINPHSSSAFTRKHGLHPGPALHVAQQRHHLYAWKTVAREEIGPHVRANRAVGHEVVIWVRTDLCKLFLFAACDVVCQEIVNASLPTSVSLQAKWP